jgi:DNA-binding MarR family transcriptional regulator
MPRSRPRHPDPANFDRVLQFMQVMWAVDHQLQSVSKRMVTTLGLTVPQRMTLLLIGRNPHISAGELARMLHLHPGTISGIVRRLEEAMLVARAADAGDARRTKLILTRRGREVNRRRAGTFEDAVRKTLAETSASDVASAERVLRDLAERLRGIVHASEETMHRLE